MGIFDETYIKFIEACPSEYFGNPVYGYGGPKKYKPATKSPKEQKKCKSCKYFSKLETYYDCSMGARQVWPLKEACSSYTKRKRKLK